MRQQAELDAPASFDQADLEALRESIVSVLADECGSLAVHAFIDGKNSLDKTLWRQGAELGWLAVALPEAYGGLGMGARGLDVLHAELGRFTAPGPFLATLAAAQTLLATADPAICDTWLPRIAAGEISLAVPAKVGANPPAGARITLLGAEDAAAALVPLDKGWALVDLANARISRVSMWDRTRCMLDVELGDAAILASLPDDGSVPITLAHTLSLGIAADSIGGSREISARTIEYMKNRVQFGRPIASFQALKHRAADQTALIATNEHLVAQAVESTALGDPSASMWSALAKAAASDVFLTIGSDCVQLHGGVGFTWEYDPHIYLKRARLNEVLVATNMQLRDRAGAELAAATRSGRSTLEIPAS